ncbi:MAG TPA: hypothetical protein DEP66_07410, partial [Acidimicrobiaceae bacterium]|nr:hypothetical protein [Acidimicrobiaceae bacterium]
AGRGTPSDLPALPGVAALAVDVLRLRPDRTVAYVRVADDAAARDAVRRLRQAGHPAVLGPPDAAHVRGWLNRNRATAVAGDLAVCFPWSPCDAARVVEIDVGAAFGTGSHPSTLLLARLLAELLAPAPAPTSVLDVGCGSGVLSLVAARLGAARVLGIDTSPTALASARAGARLNGFAAPAAAPALRFTSRPLADVAGTFDVVVANIAVDVLDRLAPALAARLAPDGVLGLGGISAPQASRLSARLGTLGVACDAVRRLDDWCALVGRRTGRRRETPADPQTPRGRSCT